ncbi:hypothetical protein GYMLUDRAFT_59702 [Collybiopsis luxurians FD-317 M1]|uniref:Uncharacterized protein n=1 Tax=Collybiopsis luxurians FD-317 M1 TaxID=944289 RepID=A0A0D0CCK6_9AGAR|nr:hypothetical protein GYMLUDRAFT_59702 [Collybiopsis luxurians FD-317 M1]
MDIATHEEAAQWLRDQWEVDNADQRAQYQAQVQEEQELLEQRRQEAANAERLKEAERKERELELAKEAEKKHTPLYTFQKGKSIASIPSQLHPHAKKLMTVCKYIPLWYFLPEAAAEAKEQNKESVDTNCFQIAMDDSETSGSLLTLVGSHAACASPNAIPDVQLTWAQLGVYPNKFIVMFAGFYTNMDMHQELRELEGELVMAHYHAKMHLAWYNVNDRKEPFDLLVISESILETS